MTTPKKPVQPAATDNKSTVSSVADAEKVSKESPDLKAASEPGDTAGAVDHEHGGNLDPEAQFPPPRPAGDTDSPKEPVSIPDGTAVRPGGGIIDPAGTIEDDDEDEDDDPDGTNAPEGEIRSLAQNLKTGPVSAMTHNGEEVIPSDDGPEEEISGFQPMHNGEGHRCAFINPEGKMSIMDDETAKMFYDDPNFYAFVYDASYGDRRSVNVLRWCDRNGNPTGGHPGDTYELGK